jgi:pimeloyl-ACP methyl ester carboxylesterase
MVIAGDRDFFTPVEVSQEMASAIPGSEVMIVRGGSHYTPIEYPMVVNLRIDKFLRERLEADWQLGGHGNGRISSSR